MARAYLGLYERAARTPGIERRGVEVVVVAYGRPDLLADSLQPVLSFPVTVVDNSSSADVAAVCARLGVRYLDPGSNGGFGAGVNHALDRRLDPDADVLLLNPDAVIGSDDVRRLHQALLADPTLASVAPTQVDEAGEPSRVSWPFPSPGRAWLVAAGLGRLGGTSGFVIGSVMMLRREALAQVGRFDEAFFLYAEETDWAYRAHRLGWRHREVTEARARARRRRHEHRLHPPRDPLPRRGRSATCASTSGRCGGSSPAAPPSSARPRAASCSRASAAARPGPGPLCTSPGRSRCEARPAAPTVPTATRCRRVPDDVARSCVCRASTTLMLAGAGGASWPSATSSPSDPSISLVVGLGVCLFGLTLMDSAIIPLLMVVPVLVDLPHRAAGADLTLSDAALFIAFFPALIFADGRTRPRCGRWCGSASSTR